MKKIHSYKGIDIYIDEVDENFKSSVGNYEVYLSGYGYIGFELIGIRDTEKEAKLLGVAQINAMLLRISN